MTISKRAPSTRSAGLKVRIGRSGLEAMRLTLRSSRSGRSDLSAACSAGLASRSDRSCRNRISASYGGAAGGRAAGEARGVDAALLHALTTLSSQCCRQNARCGTLVKSSSRKFKRK